MTLWLILTLLMGGAALIVLAPFFFGRGANETPTNSIAIPSATIPSKA